MPLKIGIKYCGGCNPRYDRKKFIEAFTSIAGEVYQVSFVKEGECYDYIIVLAGCQSACIDTSSLKYKIQILYVTKPTDPLAFLSKIEKQ